MNPWRSLRELPRGVWIVCAAMLVNRAGTMVLPFLVLYLSQSLGIAPARAALLMSRVRGSQEAEGGAGVTVAKK